MSIVPDTVGIGQAPLDTGLHVSQNRVNRAEKCIYEDTRNAAKTQSCSRNHFVLPVVFNLRRTGHLQPAKENNAARLALPVDCDVRPATSFFILVVLPSLA